MWSLDTSQYVGGLLLFHCGLFSSGMFIFDLINNSNYHGENPNNVTLLNETFTAEQWETDYENQILRYTVMNAVIFGVSAWLHFSSIVPLCMHKCRDCVWWILIVNLGGAFLVAYSTCMVAVTGLEQLDNQSAHDQALLQAALSPNIRELRVTRDATLGYMTYVVVVGIMVLLGIRQPPENSLSEKGFLVERWSVETVRHVGGLVLFHCGLFAFGMYTYVFFNGTNKFYTAIIGLLFLGAAMLHWLCMFLLWIVENNGILLVMMNLMSALAIAGFNHVLAASLLDTQHLVTEKLTVVRNASLGFMLYTVGMLVLVLRGDNATTRDKK